MIVAAITELVDWSRAQFALTAMYHWLFVPLTLGLGFICAFMETVYYRKGKNPVWRRITRFWMRLFAINFAIGVATGLILEFEFGTNWSNYSYLVGDIFGAPLAIEGIFAFFMESTFFAVMFFGWDKVSPRFHLAATWLTAIGATLSAYWILVANAWMQYPAGMSFNIETMRNEMVNFWDVALSPVAVAKFSHTVTSGFLLASMFVVGISAWFMIRRREHYMAQKSMKIAAIFGLISSIVVIWTGDISGVQIAKQQPMKLAAMEGLEVGQKGAPFTIIGSFNSKKTLENDEKMFLWDVKVDKMLSFLAAHDFNAYVPGIKDLVYGNAEQDILPVEEKIVRGRTVLAALASYNIAKKAGDTVACKKIAAYFDKSTPEGKEFNDQYFKYFGYGHIKNPAEIIPPIGLVFYSFRIMVALGMLFIVIFAAILLFQNTKLMHKRVFLWLLVWSIPLPYIAGQAGWIVSEVGRQPWTIQDMLPVSASVSRLATSSVMVTFFIFAVLFTILLIAEIKILVKQIKIGPESNIKK